MASYSDLPEEITLDILSRLPAKSVGKCRCVSKPWHSLLSHPTFIRAHLIRRAHESLFLISRARRSFFYATISTPNAHKLFDQITFSPTRLAFFPHYPNFAARFIPGSGNGRLKFRFMLGSCHGLVLVAAWDGNKFVLNPVTRQIREVPHGPSGGADARKSSTLYGFGYDAVGDDYKVVAISCYYDKHRPYYRETVVNVYSFRFGGWRSVGGFPYGYDHFRTAFVEGRVHWLGYRTPDDRPTVLAFDLGSEELGRVEGPCHDVGASFASHVGVVGGCMCMCMCSCDGKEVWVMKEYGVKESWTRFRIDDLDGVGLPNLCMLGREHLLLNKKGKFAVCDLKEGTVKEIVVCGVEDDFTVEGSFVDSLVSPHGGHETRGK